MTIMHDFYDQMATTLAETLITRYFSALPEEIRQAWTASLKESLQMHFCEFNELTIDVMVDYLRAAREYGYDTDLIQKELNIWRC